MLSNAYFLATFPSDTAENEPAKNLQNFAKNAFSKKAAFAGLPDALRHRALEDRLRLSGRRREVHRGAAPTGSSSESVGWQNFGKMLLVFGCIGSDFCKKICV